MFSLFPFSVRRVKGHSMQPAIREGSRIIVFRWAYLFSRPKIGDVIVFRSGGSEYVKRVKALAENGFIVEGDNRSDSRKMPLVTGGSVVGRVISLQHR